MMSTASEQILQENKASYLATARLLTELITLEDEPRKVRYLSPFATAPSVADQISGGLIIGLALANLVKQNNSEVDGIKVAQLLLWHDAPEARYGDIGRDQRKYTFINEDKTRHDMFGSVPFGMEIIDLIENFEAGGDDINIKVAKDADALYVVYTIKDLLNKGFIINEPEVRIQKTLNRLATEEGFLLGTQMATRNPVQIWKLLNETAQVNGSGAPLESLPTILEIAWSLCELNKTTEVKISKNSELRRQVVTAVLTNSKPKESLVANIINDASEIYNLLESKRKLLQLPTKNKKTNQVVAKLKTPEGKILFQVISETDLYEWWNLMMGYLTLNQDGTTEKKPR